MGRTLQKPVEIPPLDDKVSALVPTTKLERQTLLMEMLNGTAKPTKEEEVNPYDAFCDSIDNLSI